MSAPPAVDARAIVAEGRYYRLTEYALRESLLADLEAAFLAGIERLAGPEVRRQVAADGLGQLHRHFPVEKVDALEQFLLERLRDELYYWSYAVGARDLGLADPFYVDDLIVLRIHYPYMVARGAGRSERPPFALHEKFRLLRAAARDPRLALHHVQTTLRRRRMVREHRVHYDPAAYHGDLPRRARSHGAHVDTWYGHSYDGMNLWLSIAGVNEDNTVILYPEMFGRRVTYDPKSMYLAAGIPLPRPYKVPLAPGELLVFNPEMLHGTQVNISDETRVALTTRINPHAPRFNDEAPFNFEHWYASTDLARRRFGRLRLFAAHRHRGAPSVSADPVLKRVREIVLPAWSPDADAVLCRSDDVAAGQRVAIDAPGLAVLLARTAAGLVAYDRRCPHRGIDIKDGFADERAIFCPGHGVAFDLASGTSRCPAFTLRAVPVVERDGVIVLPARAASAGRVAPAALPG